MNVKTNFKTSYTVRLSGVQAVNFTNYCEQHWMGLVTCTSYGVCVKMDK